MRKNRILALVICLSLLLPCFSVTAAEDYMSGFTATISGAKGNIVFDIDENATLALDATGISSVNEDLYAKVKIITASGDLISNDIVDLSGSMTARYTIDSVPHYGIYTMKIDLYGKDSGRYYGQQESTFSMVNGPKNGTVNPVHGVCVHYREGQDLAAFGDSTITAELAAKAGFSSARGEITWNKYATYDADGNATYNMASRQSNIMNKISGLGMDVLEILSYDHSKYPMANASGSYNTSMTEPFVKYAESLTEKVLAMNPGSEFEIWNEWNNEGSWFNEKSLSPQAYAKLAKAVYEKIGDKTTLWGMSTLDVDTKWIEKVLEEWDNDGYFWQNKNDDQKLYMDGISLHPYANWSQPEGSAYINTPEWTEDDTTYKGPIDKTKELKAMLTSRNIGSTPLRATEWGWISTGAKAYQNNSSTDATQVFVGYYPNRAMQAAYFVRMAALSEANDLYDKMDYYQINSKNGADDSDYGLLLSSTSKVPYGAKPAYLAAANYNRLMTGATPAANAVTVNDDVYMTLFTLADGRDCAILWSAALDANRTKAENISKNVSLTVGDSSVILCDMLGNEVSTSSSTGTYNLRVDGEPVYVIGNFSGATLSSAGAGSMINGLYYNELKDRIVITGDATDISAVLKLNGEVKQELEVPVAANTVNASIIVDPALAAGDYVLEVTADGNTYVKGVTIPERIIQEERPETTTSSFEPGMIALYTAATRNVKVIGKLTDRNENEPIVVMVAKAPVDGAEILDEDIAYVEVFDGSSEDFALEFTLPEGSYGKYVVRAGAMYANNAVQNGLANPDYAVVCTFDASAEENSITATATFENHSAQDAQPAVMFIAQYAGEVLETVKSEPYTVNKADGRLAPPAMSVAIDEDATVCRVFIWNSQNELVPLVAPIEIPVVK